MDGLWVRRPVGLRFILGEVPLFQVNLTVLRLEDHFSTLDEHPDDRRLAGFMAPGVEGLLVRSHPVREPLPRISRVEGLLRYVPNQYMHYYTSLQVTWEQFLKQFGKKTLQEIQRKVRRLTELCGGQIDLREYRRPEQMEELYRCGREISSQTYQERLLGVGFPQGPRWQADLTRQAAEDRVRAWVMFHDGRPISYQYASLAGGVVAGKYLGYLGDYHKHSPGTVLHYLMFKRLIDEGGYVMFDHGQGEGPHKQLFATGSVSCADLYYVRPTLRLKTIIRLHDTMERLSARTGKCLQNMRLKDRVKKLLRQRA